MSKLRQVQLDCWLDVGQQSLLPHFGVQKNLVSVLESINYVAIRTIGS